MERTSWDDYFMNIARLVASRSTCNRAQYGSLVVRDNNILTTGYNGALSGQPHCSDFGQCTRQRLGALPGQRYELCVALHSEMNAITQAAKNGISLKGATLYVPGIPCLMCAKLIVSSGITTVVCEDTGRYASSDNGLEVLKASGVLVKILRSNFEQSDGGK